MSTLLEFSSNSTEKIDYDLTDAGKLFADEYDLLTDLVSKPLEVAGLSVYTPSTYLHKVVALLENNVKTLSYLGNDIFKLNSKVFTFNKSFVTYIMFTEAYDNLYISINNVNKPLTNVDGSLVVASDIALNRPTMLKYNVELDSLVLVDSNEKNIIRPLPKDKMLTHNDHLRITNPTNDNIVFKNINEVNTMERADGYVKVSIVSMSNSTINDLTNPVVIDDYHMLTTYNVSLKSSSPRTLLKDKIIVLAKVNVLTRYDSSTSTFSHSVNHTVSRGNDLIKDPTVSIGVSIIDNPSIANGVSYIVDLFLSTTTQYGVYEGNDPKLDPRFIQKATIILEEIKITPMGNMTSNIVNKHRYENNYTSVDYTGIINELYYQYMGERVEYTHYGDSTGIMDDINKINTPNINEDINEVINDDKRITISSTGKLYMKGELASNPTTEFNVITMDGEKGDITSRTTLDINNETSLPSQYDISKEVITGSNTTLTIKSVLDNINSIVPTSLTVFISEIDNNGFVYKNGFDWHQIYSTNPVQDAEVVTRYYASTTDLQPIALPPADGLDYRLGELDRNFRIDSPYISNVNGKNKDYNFSRESQIHHLPYTHTLNSDITGSSIGYTIATNLPNDIRHLFLDTRQGVLDARIKSTTRTGSSISYNDGWEKVVSTFETSAYLSTDTVIRVTNSLSQYVVNDPDGVNESYFYELTDPVGTHEPFINSSITGDSNALFSVNGVGVTANRFPKDNDPLYGKGVNEFNYSLDRHTTRVFQPLYKTGTHRFTIPIHETETSCVFLDVVNGNTYVYGINRANRFDCTVAPDPLYTTRPIIEEPEECFVNLTTPLYRSTGIHVYDTYTVVEFPHGNSIFNGLTTSMEGVGDLFEIGEFRQNYNIFDNANLSVPKADLIREIYHHGKLLVYAKNGVNNPYVRLYYSNMDANNLPHYGITPQGYDFDNVYTLPSIESIGGMYDESQRFNGSYTASKDYISKISIQTEIVFGNCENILINSRSSYSPANAYKQVPDNLGGLDNITVLGSSTHKDTYHSFGEFKYRLYGEGYIAKAEDLGELVKLKTYIDTVNYDNDKLNLNYVKEAHFTELSYLNNGSNTTYGNMGFKDQADVYFQTRDTFFYGHNSLHTDRNVVVDNAYNAHYTSYIDQSSLIKGYHMDSKIESFTDMLGYRYKQDGSNAELHYSMSL